MKAPVELLNILQNAGYAAYFVGGCVRDALLGRPAHDWDIATAARPEQIMEVFPKCVPTGLQHGTVTVLWEGEGYEVTTFRCDGTYRDSRHPDSVQFVTDLREDLARRDFTVNAMAMNAAGEITDPFCGRTDLEQKCLRCVHEPEQRFREDALRMLRALRFSAQLGFTIEKKTYQAIRTCAPLSAALSAERVRDEVEKTLLSPDPQAVSEMSRLGLLEAYGLTGDLALAGLSDLPADRTVRWAAFFAACPQANWQDFRLDRRTGEIARQSAALSGFPRSRLQWKKLLCVHGEPVARCTAALQGEAQTVEEILSSGECLSRKTLAVSGKDFPDCKGKMLGQLLTELLYHVLENPTDNDREKLLEIAQKLF